MTGTPPRRIVRLLTSPRLATVLIALVGVWAVLASFVPQGAADSAMVTEWAGGRPGLAALTGAIGLHHAFSAPIFLACVALLGVCTIACAWQRTLVAAKRTRVLRAAAASPDAEPDARADLAIACREGMAAEDALASAADVLGVLGIRVRRHGRGLSAVSPAWSVWGSAVFHWALVALIAVIALGNLARSSGQIGLAVGQTKPDEPASYGMLKEGPLHTFAGGRAIRLDAFDVSYETGGVDRGPTPTVTVLDSAGEVIETQLVYPNKTLKTGSLTIYPYDYGLSATVAILDESGAEVQRSTQLIDFSSTAEGGTAPVDALVLRDTAGDVQYRMFLSVPLDAAEGGGLAARLPGAPRARVVITDAGGEAALDETIEPGEGVPLPGGGVLGLADVGYYARLQLVDDPSIPLLYAAAIVAMLGLGAATLVRQMWLLAWIAEEDGACVLKIRMRLWRALTTSRSEIEAELARALGPADEGSAS